MSAITVEQGVCALRNGELVTVFDDVKTQMASLVGIAERVSPQNVNLMTKIAKGLVYVCIPEKMAAKLNLPLMITANTDKDMKPFTVSVDYMTTTTGISAFERSDTIHAFTNENLQLEHFRTPGHIFPLVSKEKGLLERVNIVEAAGDLAKMGSDKPVAYMCEILNDSGEVANKLEVQNISEKNGISVLNLSDLIEHTRTNSISSFSGRVVKGKQSGKKIGFPTANIKADSTEVDLEKGVYGVHVLINNVKYVGVMNVGTNYNIYILDFNKTIYDQFVLVDVKFFVRAESSFYTLDDLVNQITKDVIFVEERFGLQKC